MEHFTPITGFIGGVMIGIAASLFLVFNRQICGISGIFEGILPPLAPQASWRFAFIFGLLSGGAALRLFYPPAFDFTIASPLWLMLLAGFLVGFGSRYGRGCTSGHGVCGIGRLAPRSIFASLTFFITGIVTASLIYVLKGSIQ